jgi:hypothetical protein
MKSAHVPSPEPRAILQRLIGSSEPLYMSFHFDSRVALGLNGTNIHLYILLVAYCLIIKFESCSG